ncbi:MAG: hypothetical protein O3A93_02740 [Chloroflexi bacterium]|nr:hypothetical protein [Chloroflexota bacterium]MDA1270166.1 hypothetical protein [Chloroflexota bacterium]
MNNARPSAGIGCGGLVAVLGLVLISPIGEFLISGIGWILIVIGVFAVLSGIYYWFKNNTGGGV